jgi:ankyrin repeat protein
MAAQEGHELVVQYLVKELDLDVNHAAHKDGGTPLHIAAQVRNMSMVQFLVKEFGANINQPRYDGGTPLMAASHN